MKKRIITLVTAGLISNMTFAQDTMYVFPKTGGFFEFPVSNIDSVTFKAPKNKNIVNDVDGNVYPTITIGTQTWMAQNLNTTHYNDGSLIPLVTNTNIWASNYNSNGQNQMMCWYDNDKATYTANKYGALYNWFSVKTGKLCPIGWHVPSDAEWNNLYSFLGGIATSGGKLKEVGFSNWKSPNTGATNSVGFNTLPSGARNNLGGFDVIGNQSVWWSTTAYDTTYIWMHAILNNNSSVLRGNGNKFQGFSVRCLKD